MTITERQIIEALHDRYWRPFSDNCNRVTISYDNYKIAVFRSGLIKTMSTAKIRWYALVNAVGFHEQTNSNTYAVDLQVVRDHYELRRESTETEREIEEAY